MDAQALARYVTDTGVATNDAWKEEPLRKLSSRQVPPDILGSQAWLLEADTRLTWTRWFIEGMANPSRYSRDHRLGYSHLYEEVQNELRRQHPTVPVDEVRMTAQAISEFAWDDVVRSREAGRTVISRQLREDLWFAAEPSPGCYLCGYRFSSWARDRLLGREGNNRSLVELPVLVDFTRPRGTVTRDVCIEVDHVYPVRGGGQTTFHNLRLACGWCNRVKSDRRSLYEVSAGSAGTIEIGALGTVTIPQPFWVLRLVATRARCEHQSGCRARLTTEELFVAPRSPQGALNPVNAIVYCAVHDPWANARFVGRDVIRQS